MKLNIQQKCYATASRLARALANDPGVLLMDEAFSALDPLIKSDMQDELLAIQSKLHKTIVL
jgi:glycine betaine/proline transport system ATP-binding protein